MLSGTPTTSIEVSDGSLTSGQIGAMDAFGATMIATLMAAGDEWELGIPETPTDGWEDITDARARETPSSVTSRRIREFLIG